VAPRINPGTQLAPPYCRRLGDCDTQGVTELKANYKFNCPKEQKRERRAKHEERFLAIRTPIFFRKISKGYY
jgi:hypothetical protein